MNLPVSLHVNSQARENDPPPGLGLLDPEAARTAFSFHRTIPGYAPTPLADLTNLADFLGIGRLWVKDESRRFRLNAFKVLGASYAMGELAACRLGLNPRSFEFKDIRAGARTLGPVTFATATDGNHGRAVAWTARQFGCQAVIYLPAGTAKARIEAVENEEARAVVVQGNYDDAVRVAASDAQEHGWTLIQDTAWDGYEDIPTRIMEGYTSLVTEAVSQTEGQRPTHVMIQAGVGSLATGILAGLHARWGRDRPHLTVVEPVNAAPFFLSAQADDRRARVVEGELNTIMAGLACGEASTLAWQALGKWADVFCICEDDVARRGMRVLGNPLHGDPRVVSGESGAVGAGMLFDLCTDLRLEGLRLSMGLGPGSRVLLFSTEGDTDPSHYRQVVWGGF